MRSFSAWSIRNKTRLSTALIVFTIAVLSISGVAGVFAFRGLAKSISLRGTELPLAMELTAEVSRLQVTYDNYKQTLKAADHPEEDFVEFKPDFPDHSSFKSLLLIEFRAHVRRVNSAFHNYRAQIQENQISQHYPKLVNRAATGLGTQETESALEQFAATLDEIARIREQNSWEAFDVQEIERLDALLAQLNRLSMALPSDLHERISAFADQVRDNYRFWIVIVVGSGALGVCVLAISTRLFHLWIFRPLETLFTGSQRVAAGDFDHRLEVQTQDEMAQLAGAMNDMTQRFREIRDDLDQQVRQRTKEVVRSEQLASVGFLAAGVAHEINNPLASIALCAESLEERLRGLLTEADREDDDLDVVRTYLKMIQDEAFRCKEITERLLDFSRLGDVKKQSLDLAELTQSVVDMVRHLGKYQHKTIAYQAEGPVVASVNAQEMKQVVLNLLTNGLDSLDPGGTVEVKLLQTAAEVVLMVSDNGCGMTAEVQKHLFEPFFTRRRDGQGTGLGLSITYRIVADHGGNIEVFSAGAGSGSRFTLTLPRGHHDQDSYSLPQAA